jgi:hypothetical protein
MKKFMLAVLAGLMIVGFASSAMAEITVGGSIEERYQIGNGGVNDDDTTSYNFFDSRILLHVDAKVAEGLEGYIELDSDSQDSFTNSTNRWGLDTNVPASGALIHYLNHTDNALSIRQAWINFMVPGAPVGVKIGHQGLALGHGIWLDTTRYGSDAILVYSKPVDNLLVAAAYVKGSESFDPQGNNVAASGSNSDADFYAMLANYTWMENNTAGMNFTYVDDKGTVALATGGDIWATNVALVMDGTIAGINYKGEVDYLHVDVDKLAAGGAKDYKINAYAAMLGANMNIANMATVGMEAAMGTGNKRTDVNHFMQFANTGFTIADQIANPAFSGEDSAYFTPYYSGSYNYAFIYNDKMGQGVNGAGGGMGFGDGFGGAGLANTFYVKLSAEVTPMDRLKAGMDVLYLRAHHTMDDAQASTLGWEIDANVSYAIYDNLDLDLNGGYFITGDWYKFEGIAVPALDTSNVWAAETKLTMKF